MPWKIEKVMVQDSEGKAAEKSIVVVDDTGNPIWVHENDGKEVGVDAKHYFTKIPQMIEEARALKQGKKIAEDQLATIKASFEGIDDPEKAREALKLIETLDQKKMIDAKKVDELKAALKSEYDKALEKERGDKDKIIKDLQDKSALQAKHISKLTISNAFKGSPVLNGDTKKVILPVEVSEKYWAEFFKPTEVNGELLPVGYIGENPIYSKERPGELASFDEAISIIINEHCPFKETILKGNQNSGGGAQGGGSGDGGNGGGARDLGAYKTDADFKTSKEKQDYIQKYGLEKFQTLVRAGRQARVNELRKQGQAPLHK